MKLSNRNPIKAQDGPVALEGGVLILFAVMGVADKFDIIILVVVIVTIFAASVSSYYGKGWGCISVLLMLIILWCLYVVIPNIIDIRSRIRSSWVETDNIVKISTSFVYRITGNPQRKTVSLPMIAAKYSFSSRI